MHVRRSAGLVSATLLLFALPGCGILGEEQLEFDDTEQARISTINIEPGSGDVVIRTGAVSEVQIKRVVRYRGGEPGDKADYRIDGTELFLDTDCGQWCNVSYDVLAPQGVSVRGGNGSGEIELTDVAEATVSTGSGSISVTKASGAVRAETGSGEIELTDVAEATVKTGSGSISVTKASGAVRAEAGSGEITLSEIGGALSVKTGSGGISGQSLGGEVTASAGSGGISLQLTRAASVRAQASSGTVELTVPDGSYQVSTEAGSGHVQSEIGHDPGAALQLQVKTGSGNIRIRKS